MSRLLFSKEMWQKSPGITDPRTWAKQSNKKKKILFRICLAGANLLWVMSHWAIQSTGTFKFIDCAQSVYCVRCLIKTQGFDSNLRFLHSYSHLYMQVWYVYVCAVGSCASTCVCPEAGPWCSSGAGRSQWAAPTGAAWPPTAGRPGGTGWWRPACQHLQWKI